MTEVYIDGASAGNPGPSGVGIFIRNEEHSEKKAFPVGVMNNHEAEFTALIKALEYCRDQQYHIVFVRSDSSLVVDAMEKKFVRNREYNAFLQHAMRLAATFDLFFIKWIPSKENKAADDLAKKAIRMNGG